MAAGKRPDPADLYMEGLNLVRVEKNYVKGLEVFQRFLKLHPKSKLADNAQYWIGEIYYVQGQWEKAAIQFQKIKKNYPGSDKTAAALLKQGLSFEKLGEKESAISRMKKVVREFPDSEEARIARKRLKKLEGSPAKKSTKKKTKKN